MTTLDDWAARWAAGHIGFHEGAPNDLLVRHGALLHAAEANGAHPPRVLVPLCGKTMDLEWLAQRGFAVVGVEAVEQACRAFFDERGAPTSLTPRAGGGAVVRTGAEHPTLASVSLVCVDFFSASAPASTPSTNDPLRPGFTAGYDRAALVAVPPARRADYVEVVAALLAPGAPLLLVSFEYDQARVDGPPWSLPEGDVRALFSARFDVTHLESRAVPVRNARLAAAGVNAMSESCYLLRRRVDVG